MSDLRAQLPSSRAVAWIFAAAFAVTTLVGFLPNPLVGKNAIFVTNAAHNLVHLLTAVGFAVVASLGDRPSMAFMKAFGVVYLLVGVLGFAMLGSEPEGHLLGVVHINQLDNVLHIGLGAVILVSGFVFGERSGAAASA